MFIDKFANKAIRQRFLNLHLLIPGTGTLLHVKLSVILQKESHTIGLFSIQIEKYENPNEHKVYRVSIHSC